MAKAPRKPPGHGKRPAGRHKPADPSKPARPVLGRPQPEGKLRPFAKSKPNDRQSKAADDRHPAGKGKRYGAPAGKPKAPERPKPSDGHGPHRAGSKPQREQRSSEKHAAKPAPAPEIKMEAPPPPPVLTHTSEAHGERIAKLMARAGVCSRRDAEKLIAEGRVTLNGETVTTPATKVTGIHVIAVDGKPVADPEQTRLWRYHKPAGLVTTHKDPEGRPTVFQNLPKTMPRVVSVGRLDVNSEGLLLLTNDGEIARRLEHPSAGLVRKYRVRVFGKITQADLEKLAEGITIDGVKYGPVIADLERAKGMYAWVMVSLKEGKNREVKRLMEHLGCKVARLIRVQYGPFHLGHLLEGTTEEIPAKLWREQLGLGRKKRAKD